MPTTMKIVGKDSQFEMRPGSIRLNVHLEVDWKRHKTERSQGAGVSLLALRIAAGVRIRKGLLPVSRIVDGRAIVPCDENLYDQLVEDVLEYRERRRQRRREEEEY